MRGTERHPATDVKPSLRQQPFPVFHRVLVMHRKEPKPPSAAGDNLFVLSLLVPAQVILEWTAYLISEEKDAAWGQDAANLRHHVQGIVKEV